MCESTHLVYRNKGSVTRGENIYHLWTFLLPPLPPPLNHEN